MPIMKDSRSYISAFTILISLITLSILGACSVEKPESPSWITNWDIPIANNTYGIIDILEDIGDSNLVIDSAGNPGFEITQD
jgi:hypothetical protein